MFSIPQNYLVPLSSICHCHFLFAMGSSFFTTCSSQSSSVTSLWVSMSFCNHTLTCICSSLQQVHVLHKSRTNAKEFIFGISQNQDLNIARCASSMKLLKCCFYFSVNWITPSHLRTPTWTQDQEDSGDADEHPASSKHHQCSTSNLTSSIDYYICTSSQLSRTASQTRQSVFNRSCIYCCMFIYVYIFTLEHYDALTLMETCVSLYCCKQLSFCH